MFIDDPFKPHWRCTARKSHTKPLLLYDPLSELHRTIAPLLSEKCLIIIHVKSTPSAIIGSHFISFPQSLFIHFIHLCTRNSFLR